MDLIFPHHECEIAQSESYTGKPFVKYWVHNGFVTINQEKMSKSLGNFFTIREVLEKYDGETIRFFLLGTHYRSQIDYSEQHLQEAKQNLQKIYNAINKLKTLIKGQDQTEINEPGAEEKELLKQVEKSKQEFIDALDDDFNTREAMPTIFELTKAINSLHSNSKISKNALETALQTYEEFGQILGLFQEKQLETDLETVGKLVELLIELRNRSREKKDWKTADYIRDKLKEAGILIEDSKEGTTWKTTE